MTKPGGHGALSRWRAEFWRALAAGGSLAAALALVATTYGMYEVRAAGDARRAPQYAATFESGTTGITTDFAELPGVGQFSVVYLQARGDEAPMPPGLERDLAPGEVALSPALVAYAERHPDEHIDQRYGKVVSTIAPDGLSAPDEHLVYAAPATPAKPTQVVSAFGANPGFSPWQVGNGSAIFGESMQIFGLAYPLLGVIILILLPALLLVTAAAHSGVRPRQRHDLILTALGSPPGFRRRTRLAGGLPGAITGAALGAALVSIWVASSPRVPIVGSQLASGALPTTRTVGIAITAAAVTTIVWALMGRSRMQGNRPTVRSLRLPSWLVLLGPLLLWASYAITQQVRDNATAFAILTWFFALLCVPAVAISAAAATTGIGSALRRWALRRGNPSGIVAGAWLSNGGRRAFVLALVVLGISTVAFQAAQNSLVLTEPGAEGRRIAQTVGPGVAQVELYRGQPTAEWHDHLPSTYGVIAVRDDVLVGECALLNAVDLPCDEPISPGELTPRARALTSTLVLPDGATTRASSAPVAQDAGTYLVVARDGGTVRLSELAVASNAADGGLAKVGRPGDDWGSGEGYVIQARWIVPMTVLGLGIALAALVLSSLGAARDLASQMAGALALFAPRRRGVLAITTIAAGLPFVMSGVAAGYAGRTQAIPTLRKIDVPGALDPLTYVIVGGACVAALCSIALSTRLIVLAASTWRPGRER